MLEAIFCDHRKKRLVFFLLVLSSDSLICIEVVNTGFEVGMWEEEGEWEEVMVGRGKGMRER